MLAACAGLCVLLALAPWRGGSPDRAVVRAGGKVFAEASLARDRSLEVPGPLGTTVIDIRAGRARVASDPGPRQHCVRQGWLSRSGDVALCLPNQVSLELTGGERRFDSLNY